MYALATHIRGREYLAARRVDWRIGVAADTELFATRVQAERFLRRYREVFGPEVYVTYVTL